MKYQNHGRPHKRKIRSPTDTLDFQYACDVNDMERMHHNERIDLQRTQEMRRVALDGKYRTDRERALTQSILEDDCDCDSDELENE